MFTKKYLGKRESIKPDKTADALHAISPKKVVNKILQTNLELDLVY